LDIIPVIDLMDGQVVHAKHGDRQNYRPIKSALCNDSEPLHIVSSLLQLYPFKRIYIADINAIQGRGHHGHLIRQLRSQYPAMEIWLDAGIKQAETAKNWQQQGIYCVIGSESLGDMYSYHQIKQTLTEQFALSLDFARGQFIGPDQLLREERLWPRHVIAMSLDKVGSGSGPDIPLLDSLQRGAVHVYAAGGVRNTSDLLTLKTSGISGVLVASMLHAGQLSSKEIEDITRQDQ
jgi:phosphoribosylformimino-5-aminoimidazole carboxamide ribotide isomerase